MYSFFCINKNLKKQGDIVSFKELQRIPTKEDVISLLPLTNELAVIRQDRINELKYILSGKSDKFIVIIGPCSADREDSVLEYMKKLAEVNEEVKDKLYIIPRVYTNKPRTTGEGYKGMLHQPDVNEKPDLIKGIYAIRDLHLKVLEQTHFITADEMLYPENFVYLEDILGYVAIGARSVENQQHRLVSSGMDVPVGMKNPTSGDLSIMFNSIYASGHPHTFIFHDNEVETTGNEYSHSILRGYVNKKGESIPNYHYEDLINCINQYKSRELRNEAIIVDTNHSNSDKKYDEQPRIAYEILHSKKESKLVDKYVKGIMIESYIEDGSQKVSDDMVWGKSITDPCLGFEKTKKLLYNMANKLEKIKRGE